MRIFKNTNYLVILLLGACQPNSLKNNNEKEKIEVNKVSVQETGKSDKKKIIFFGNSITAGYQLDIDDAFPSLIQQKIDSLHYPYLCINAGLSGETTTSGLERIDWVLRTKPDVFFLELGANDGLRGIDLSLTKSNLLGIIQKVRIANPNVKIILAGMKIPPNLGIDYTKTFEKIFSDLVMNTDIVYIPFLLENVAGNPDLNLPDGIHPTAKGHQIVAETVWKYLNPLLSSDPQLYE